MKTGFPNFGWWAIVYLFLVIVGVFVAVGSDSTHTYQVAVSQACLFNGPKPPANTEQIVGFLAAGLTYSTAIVNTLVYSSDGAKEASAAGFILLSMVMVRQDSMSYARLVLTYTDCLDLLFWFEPPSRSPRIHRLLCSSQRTASLDTKQQTNKPPISPQRQTRDDRLG